MQINNLDNLSMVSSLQMASGSLPVDSATLIFITITVAAFHTWISWIDSFCCSLESVKVLIWFGLPSASYLLLLSPTR